MGPHQRPQGPPQPGRAPCGALDHRWPAQNIGATRVRARRRSRMAARVPSPPPPNPCAQARRALCAVTPAMAQGSRHPHGAEPVSSQTGDDGWSPLQAAEGWGGDRGRAGRTHREGHRQGLRRGPPGRQAPPPRALLPPGPATRAIHHPSIRPPQVALHLVRPWGLTSGKRPSDAVQPVPTCTVPSAKLGRRARLTGSRAAAGLGSWDQVSKCHPSRSGVTEAQRHAGPQPEASNPHPDPSLSRDSPTMKLSLTELNCPFPPNTLAT